MFPIRLSAEEQSLEAQATAASVAQVAAGIQETDATANSLAQQARVMSELVGAFRIHRIVEPAPATESGVASRLGRDRLVR